MIGKPKTRAQPTPACSAELQRLLQQAGRRGRLAPSFPQSPCGFNLIVQRCMIPSTHWLVSQYRIQHHISPIDPAAPRPDRSPSQSTTLARGRHQPARGVLSRALKLRPNAHPRRRRRARRRRRRRAVKAAAHAARRARGRRRRLRQPRRRGAARPGQDQTAGPAGARAGRVGGVQVHRVCQRDLDGVEGGGRTGEFCVDSAAFAAAC